jgi:hypothetical protein
MLATFLPFRFSISSAQRTIGSALDQRRATQHVCTKPQRICDDPALVIDVTCFLSPLECSPGTKPKYDSIWCAPEKRVTSSTVDDACKAALEIGVPTYRFVKRYLERGPPLRLGLKQVGPLIRQLTEYRDLIDRRTRSPE